STALKLPDQAACRCFCASRAVEASRRGPRPARARSRALDDMDRRTGWKNTGGRRFLGVSACPWPLSRSRLQSVQDRTQQSRMAMRSDHTRYRRNAGCWAVDAGAADVAPANVFVAAYKFHTAAKKAKPNSASAPATKPNAKIQNRLA